MTVNNGVLRTRIVGDLNMTVGKKRTVFFLSTVEIVAQIIVVVVALHNGVVDAVGTFGVG